MSGVATAGRQVSRRRRGGSAGAMSDASTTTGTADALYDLVLVTQQALEDCLRYRKFADDARRDGDDELASFFDELGDSDEQIAGKAKAMLKARL